MSAGRWSLDYVVQHGGEESILSDIIQALKKRISSVGRIIGPPSLISKVYSIGVVFGFIYIIFKIIMTCMDVESEPDLKVNSASRECTRNLYYLEPIITYIIVIVKAIFRDSTKTLRIFDTLQDIDKELDISDGNAMYSFLKWNVLGPLIYHIISYGSSCSLWIYLDELYTKALNIPVLATVFLIEFDLIICSLLLLNIEMRLRFVAALICQKLSLQQPVKFKGRQKWLKHIHWASIGIFSEMINDTMTVNMLTLYKLYDRLLKAYDLINSLFNLQIFLFFVNNILNVLLSMQYYIQLLQTKEQLPALYYVGFIVWWQRVVVVVFYLSFQSEHVTQSVEELKKTLITLLADKRQEGYHSAAHALVQFIEVARPRFHVYHLFIVDLDLPYSFLSLVVTYFIVLLQFQYR